jgi:GTPase involved in cell partitioning and DNA repair
MEDFKPYLDDLKASISSQTELLNLLESSLDLLNQVNSLIEIEQKELTPYNESVKKDLIIVNNKISIIKITSEAETLKKVIAEKMHYFEKFSKQFDIEYKECLENFDKVIERANKLAYKKPQLKWLLSKQTKELLENKEAHLYFYKKVKAFLN